MTFSLFLSYDLTVKLRAKSVIPDPPRNHSKARLTKGGNGLNINP